MHMVRCAGCGYEMSIDTAASKVTDIFPPIGTAGGGYINWVSDFLADSCNRAGVQCPQCKQTGDWEGTD